MDLSQLKAAQDSLVATLRWAEEDQWTESTPCPDWDVRALVEHLITGNERFVLRLAGEQPGPPPDRSDATTRDLVEAYEKSNVEVLDAFGRPAVMQGVSQWPIGPLSGRDALGLTSVDAVKYTAASALGESPSSFLAPAMSDLRSRSRSSLASFSVSSLSW